MAVAGGEITSFVLSRVHIPHSLKEASELAQLLESFTRTHYFYVLVAIVLVYITLQTFSIPGTVFINVLCGSLFGIKVAFTLTLLCATLGASTAYGLSLLIGRKIAWKYFPDRLTAFTQEVDKHRGNLFNYLLFLRISPFLPNWFINIASPLINVPFPHFFFATLIGVSPATLIAVNAGRTVKELSGTETRLFGIRTWLTLVSLAFLALLPVGFKWYKFRAKRFTEWHSD